MECKLGGFGCGRGLREAMGAQAHKIEWGLGHAETLEGTSNLGRNNWVHGSVTNTAGK
jgi:hypothetical protein